MPSRWPLAPVPGNTHSPSCGMPASSCRAAADSGTRCSVFCLVVAPGLVHAPPPRSSLVPAHRQHLVAPRAGQGQQPDDVRRLLVRESRQRRGEPADLVGPQKPLALHLPVPLDPLHRVVAPPPPADRQREHARQNGGEAVGYVWRQPRHAGVQGLDVGMGDVLDPARPPGLAEPSKAAARGFPLPGFAFGPSISRRYRSAVAGRSFGDVVLDEPVAHPRHGGRGTLPLEARERIMPEPYLGLERRRVLPRRRRRPRRELADRVPPLPARPGPVVEHEGAAARRRHARAEAGHLAVVGDLRAPGGDRKGPHQLVVEPLSVFHGVVRVRTVSAQYLRTVCFHFPTLAR